MLGDLSANSASSPRISKCLQTDIAGKNIQVNSKLIFLNDTAAITEIWRILYQLSVMNITEYVLLFVLCDNNDIKKTFSPKSSEAGLRSASKQKD